jgi:hypothetical protein
MAGMWIPGQQGKPLEQRINQAIGKFKIAGRFKDVVRNLVDIDFGLRREAMRH